MGMFFIFQSIQCLHLLWRGRRCSGGLAELRPTLPEIPDTLCFCDFPSINEGAESVLRTNFDHKERPKSQILVIKNLVGAGEIVMSSLRRPTEDRSRAGRVNSRRREKPRGTTTRSRGFSLFAALHRAFSLLRIVFH